MDNNNPSVVASRNLSSLLSLPARPRRRSKRDLPLARLPEWARWETRPQDQGQFVLVSYATDGKYLYQSVYDDGTQSYYRKKISAKADLEQDMDVPNGDLPRVIGKWQEVNVVGGGEDY